MDAIAFFMKAAELDAKGRVRCAQVALAHAQRLAREEADAEYGSWLADKAAEERNEQWFIERGYHPERPEVLGPDYWTM